LYTFILMAVSICVHITTNLPWSKHVRENYNGHKHALWWYSHSHFPSTVVCPQTQYTKPDRQIRTCDAEGVFELLTPMKRNSHSKILLKFWNKAPLKTLMNLNLSLSLRREPRRFKGSLRGLEWLKLATKCLTTLIRTTSEQQLDKKLWGCLMLVMQRFWRRSPCLAWLQCLISSSSGTRALPPTLHDTGGDDPYDPPLVFLLKLSFVITLFCKFSISIKYYTLFG